MKQKTYVQVSGVVFAIVAGMHVLRILNGWAVNFAGIEIPMTASYVGAIAAGFLAYSAYKLMR